MKHTSIALLTAALISIAAPTHAGTLGHQPVKYNVENGVKVYRNGLNSSQKIARQTHLNLLIREEIRQEQQAAIARQQEFARQEQTAAYERGFSDGASQARSETLERHIREDHTRRRRSNRGRRYTTDLYGGYRRYSRYGYQRPAYPYRNRITRSRH